MSPDGIIGANGGVDGYNMYAYCNSNPVIYGDPSGYDAIVLVDDTFLGHLGIMVQDKELQWHHFYWGAADGNLFTSFGSVWPFGCKPKTWCEPYDGEIKLSDINNSGQYISDYDRMVRLYGDFSSCLGEMKNPTGKYNLYNNNCAQMSLGILAKANTSHAPALEKAAQELMPSSAYNALLFALPKFQLASSIRRLTVVRELR